MPRSRDLPPVPESPVRSPPVVVADEVDVTIDGLAGEPALEAKMRGSPEATRAVVLCHPHPLYGGTMHSAVIVVLAKVLAERGGERVATLRFNYRGVGKSEGEYAEGKGEVQDARAAIRTLKRVCPGAKVSVCGYSFGTFVAMRASAIEGGIERVALVAPAVRIFDFVAEDAALFAGRLSIFVGDNDEFCDVEEAGELAARLGSSMQVLEKADHYFLTSRRKLAEAVVGAIAPEITLASG